MVRGIDSFNAALTLGGESSTVGGFDVTKTAAQSQVDEGSGNEREILEWEVSITNPKKTPILKIRVEEVRSSSWLFRGTSEIACQIAVPGGGNSWSDDANDDSKTEFELVLDKFVLYRAQPESILTPFTFTVETPASVHVFDKAVTYSLLYVNEKSAYYKNKDVSGYTRDEQAESVLVKALASRFRKSFGTLAADSQSARRVNGMIQWCTVWAFSALIIVLVSRYVTYVQLEEGALPVEDRKRNTGEEKPAVDGNPIFTLEELKNPNHVTIDSKAETVRLKSAEHLRSKAQDRTRLWPSRNSTSTTPVFLELYKEAASAFLLSRDYKAVPEFVDSKAASLIDERSARLGSVKYFLWAIPSIGFVGTVVGIGNALLATIDVDAENPVTASIAKSMVSSSIGVAFDTTLVALLLSLIAMLIYHLATQAEELVVSDAADNVRELFIQGGVHIDEDARASAIVSALTNSLSDVEKSTAQLKVTADELRGIAGLDEQVKGGVNRIGKALNTLASRQTSQLKEYAERTDRVYRRVRFFGVILLSLVLVCLTLTGLVAWDAFAGDGWLSSLRPER
ncbi:MotA/TolQ/ExbB proton channel family protein [Roseiconus lacunae]|uniref:MotA/TolQ/ExbB proton channel family protein n=1 Tax=Roseiconus lacunae TaxID=2605694 RepID=UPI00135940FB|nr:MotA/TolQ/ExbB proton channel family protein [Roseiconus lacunae]